MKQNFKLLTEFVKKEKTDFWSIWLIESGQFMKAISKVAEKFKFDCYVKAYPKSKIDYIPTKKEYFIETVEDISDLSEQQFEFFIDDLRQFCELRRKMKAVNDVVGVEVVKSKKGMIWLDTWLNETKVTFESSNKF